MILIHDTDHGLISILISYLDQLINIVDWTSSLYTVSSLYTFIVGQFVYQARRRRRGRSGITDVARRIIMQWKSTKYKVSDCHRSTCAQFFFKIFSLDKLTFPKSSIFINAMM